MASINNLTLLLGGDSFARFGKMHFAAFGQRSRALGQFVNNTNKQPAAVTTTATATTIKTHVAISLWPLFSAPSFLMALARELPLKEHNSLSPYSHTHNTRPGGLAVAAD